MSSIWIRHLVGLKLEDDQLSIIPHPRTELTLHIIGKCIQASSIIGLGIVGPISAMRNNQFTSREISNSAISCGRRGATIGAAIGPFVAGAVMCVKDKTQVYDYCFRIRFNTRAMRIDRMGLMLAAGGAGCALALGNDGVTGAVLGLASGVTLAGVCNLINLLG